MVIRTIDVGSQQATLQELLSQVREGIEIVLTEDDKPVARIVPVRAPGAPRIAGLNKGAITWISGDFDAPLPDEFWLGEKS